MTRSMDVYFHDVGQGDCTHIEAGTDGSSTQEIYLIDFGFKQRQFTGDSPPYQTLQILIARITAISKKRGKSKPYLDHLFITHPDSDHWDMIFALVTGGITEKRWEKAGWPKGSKLEIGRLTYGGDPSNYKTRVYREVWWSTIYDAASQHTTLGNKKHDYQNKTTGAITPSWTGMGGDLKIYLINSNNPSKKSGSANPKSLCLIFEFDGFKVMLLGDAEPTDIGGSLKSWYAHNNYAFLQCNVLKLAHHGSRKGTPEWWPKIVKPNLAFVSGGYFWAHPYCEALANTSKAGTINTDALKHWVTCYDDVKKDYLPKQTKEAIFGNLWYVVTSNVPVTAKDQKGVTRSYGKGTYSGVAWLLQKFEGQATVAMSYSPEDVWPGIGQVPKAASGGTG